MATEASPADITGCGIMVQLKARDATKAIRILMVEQGGALERARALDLFAILLPEGSVFFLGACILMICGATTDSLLLRFLVLFDRTF